MILRLAIVCCAALLAAPVHAALTPEQQAAHVLNRLAFGPKPGDIERVAQMGVKRYIEDQLDPQSIDYPPALAQRLLALEAPHRSAGAAMAEFVELRREARSDEPGARERRRQRQETIEREIAQARLLRAVDSPRQLEEVLVEFWFNHFNVFSGKGNVKPLVASYERDAIRPHVLGSFRALLGATAKHPAMLSYLDNAASSAPRPAGANGRQRGLNENYARELMELHTLGADGGYTQKDVTELARMLTGWTFDQKALIGANETFRFDRRRHDQGSKQWLGRTIAPSGRLEGEYALDVLAVHPSTARRLSFKLAQYFVQDAPPPALVERMARVWLDSGGELRAVLRTLFASEEFMAPAALGAKFKTPLRFVISAARASGTPVTNVGPLLGAMRQLGMPLYGCQTPDGYKNTEEAWLNPDALSRRIAFATSLAAGRLPVGPGAMQPKAEPLDATRLQAALGPLVSARTRELAAAQPDALRPALLLGSPDFMQH
jgi:uncharacterized protein (DUF1800 family)